MELINVNSFLPDNTIEEFSKKYVELQAKWSIPKPIDSSLPQIPGYSHYMDLSLHKIEKTPPLLTEADRNFTPITFTENKLTDRINWYKNQVFESVTQFLLSQHPEDFNRITKLEVLRVSEISNGSVQELRKLNQVDYMFIGKLWDPSDIHLFVSWKATYKYLVKREKRDDVVMSDLTLGPEGYSSGAASVKGTKSESRGSKTEEGEIVVSFPVKEYESLTQGMAIDYIATLNLSGLKLKAEIDGSYITKEGVVLWGDSSKGTPVFLINYYKPEIADAALKKSKQVKESLNEKIENMRKQTEDLYLDMVNAVEGPLAKLREEIKLLFKTLKAKLEKLSKIVGEFAKQIAELPYVSVVNTPSGPGVAINIIMAILNILKGFANLMYECIDEIDILLEKLKFDLYAPLIPGLNGVYLAIKNLISLAKASIALVK